MSQAYILETSKVSKWALDYIQSSLEKFGFTPATTKLFKHIVACSLLGVSQKEDECWVPVSAKLVVKKLRGASWEALKVAGLINESNYDYRAGLSRKFKLTETFAAGLARATPKLGSPEALDRWDLFTGLPAKARLRRSFSDDNGHKLSESKVRILKDTYLDSVINIDNLNAFLESQEDLLKECYSRKLELRIRNDRFCLDRLHDQNFRLLPGGFAMYDPEYTFGSTGRVFARGGALQSCSNAAKAAAYFGVEGIHNYDIVASQATCLRTHLKDAGIPSQFLDNYLDDPRAKLRLQQEVGVSTEVWKTAFYSLLFGASMSAKDKSLAANFIEALGPLEGELARLRFVRVMKPLSVTLQLWKTYLKTIWVPANRTKARAGYFVVNRMDEKFLLGDDWDVNKLASHLLQGQESKVIHTLGELSHEYDYFPQANAHDGIVTKNPVPEAAFLKASLEAGLPSAKFVEKPFEDAAA